MRYIEFSKLLSGEQNVDGKLVELAQEYKICSNRNKLGDRAHCIFLRNAAIELIQDHYSAYEQMAQAEGTQTIQQEWDALAGIAR